MDSTSNQVKGTIMPEISRFFGIVIRVFYDEHNPPHFHTEYGRKKAVFDFAGNVIRGDLCSRPATNSFVNGLIFM